jgi:sugar phosphate isomerase/epimerase
MADAMERPFPLSVSFHTLEREQSVESARLLAGSSVKSVELWEPGFTSDSTAINNLRRAFSDAGVDVRTVHAEFGAELDFSSPDAGVRRTGIHAFERAINLAVKMDARILVVHPSSEPIEEEDRADRIRYAKQSIDEIVGIASGAGKAVALELLPRTCLGRSADELLQLIDQVGAEACGLCLDTNHLMGNYAQLPEAVRKMGNRLIALHCSDYDGVDEKHWPPLQGVIDWDAFLTALLEVRFAGPFHYEAHLEGDTPAERLSLLESNYTELCSKFRRG